MFVFVCQRSASTQGRGSESQYCDQGCSLDTIWRANWNIHNMEGRVIPSIYNTESWAGARGRGEKIGGTLLTKKRSKTPRLEEEDALQAKFSKVRIVLMLSFNLMPFQGG